MKFSNAAAAVLFIVAAASAALCQAGDKVNGEAQIPKYVSASPAFAEVVFRRAVLESELEELLVRYTDQFPKVVEMRLEIKELDAAKEKLLKVPEEESSKLTLALGKMLVQRAVYSTEYEMLRQRYNDEHPEVKRARKKLEIFENAIKEIL